MEPVKGGKLVNIPQAGIDLLKAQDEKNVSGFMGNSFC